MIGFCIVILAVFDFGNTGSIKGKISSYEDDNPIPNASVSIEGTGITGVTDSSGLYVLEGIPSGKMNLIVKATGFCDLKRLNVSVIPDFVTRTDFKLVSDTCQSMIVDLNERPPIKNTSYEDSLSINEFLKTGFEIIRSTDNLPIGIGTRKTMVNPGEAFDTGNLPSQRLIFAGKSESLWFAYFEEGGHTQSRKLVLFRSQRFESKAIWAGMSFGFEEFKDIDALKDFIRSCEFVVAYHSPKSSSVQNVLYTIPLDSEGLHKIYWQNK